MKLDLNCDLGEGEPVARTRALMRWITSANIACGGHAGSLASMQACVRLAQEFGVRLGAHPGPWGQADFGRGKIEITPDELDLLLLQQVGALQQIVRARGATLHHIKLHGGLYHATESSDALARRYIASVRRWWPQTKIYALAGGRVARLARKISGLVWEEAFIDRNYEDQGTLVPRGQANAVIKDIGEAAERIRLLQEQEMVYTVSGETLDLKPRTLCVHSDTADAVLFARFARQQVETG